MNVCATTACDGRLDMVQQGRDSMIQTGYTAERKRDEAFRSTSCSIPLPHGVIVLYGGVATRHLSIHDNCLPVVVAAQWICAGGQDPNELASWRINTRAASLVVRLGWTVKICQCEGDLSKQVLICGIEGEPRSHTQTNHKQTNLDNTDNGTERDLVIS